MKNTPPETPKPVSPSYFISRQAGTSRSDNESPLVSPFFDPTRTRSKQKSGDSSKTTQDFASRASPLSTTANRQDVSDWNVMRTHDTKPTTPESLPRASINPPRPARDGFEWVWFPEGYWAEREAHEIARKKNAQRPKIRQSWFNRYVAPESNGIASGEQDQPAIPDSSQVKVELPLGKSSDRRWPLKSQDSQTTSQKSRSHKLLKYFQYKLPGLSHSGRDEGLCSRTKRGMASRFPNKQKLALDSSSIPSTPSIASGTTMILEGATNYLDRAERMRNHGHHPKTSNSSSLNSRVRPGFGLAPWHRKSSSDSVISVSSSIHDLLMGRPPLSTPNPDPDPEMQYGGQKGKEYSKVEISDPHDPTFLPSEATRINTPPIFDSAEPRGFFFDLSPPELVYTPSDIASPRSKTGTLSPAIIKPRAGEGSREWWERDVSSLEQSLPSLKAAQIQHSRFEINIPEHFPDSPMCPVNPRYRGKGTGICPFHGRKQRRKTERSDSEGSVTGVVDDGDSLL
ncbi:hypothetical protein B7494_g7589 [Chlorociboria aeruginascens]|nr:hypothetical protein B7494_g7589 [Chlorociboria aeruginascens]